MTDPLHCPFCGHVGLVFGEGSTFRWLVASCGGCSASAGETRIQTLGEPSYQERVANAKERAILEWNTRTPPKEAP